MADTPSSDSSRETDGEKSQGQQLPWWKRIRGGGERANKSEAEILEEERQKYGPDADLEAEPYRSGLTVRTLVGAVFVAIVMMPASIYLSLVVGEGLGDAAQWVSIILFAELARRSFAPLKRQEIYILFLLATSLVGGGPFGSIIKNIYLQYSQEAASLGVAQRLTSENIWWVVPPHGSEAVAQRTFWHMDFFPIMGMMLIGAIMGRFQTLAAHYFLFRITSDMERLPFPMAPIAAQGVTALAEGPDGESWRWRMFSMGAMGGMLFGAIYVGIPTVTGQVFGRALELIPIPWIDFTREIGNVMPGSMIGITTDIDGFIWGMVIPFPIVAGQFVATIVTGVLLPPLLVEWGVFTSWRPGLGVIQTNVLHQLDLWISVGLGVGLPVMFLGFWQAGKALFNPEGSKGSLDAPPGRGDIPIWIAITVWAVTSLGFVFISHWLVPDFPVWIYFAFAFIYSPFISYVGARMIGHAGRHVSFPPITQAAFVLSGYKGIAIWWVGSNVSDFSAGVSRFREIELTKTKFSSYFAVEFLMYPITFALSYFFWSVIWQMSEIPSSAYPYALRFWPKWAYDTSLWQTATLQGNSTMLNAIKFDVIAWAGAIGGIAYWLVHFFRASPMWWYGMIGGLGAWPHGVFVTFAGALTAKLYFHKKFGEGTWFKWTIVVAAGFSCGQGLIGMAGVAIALIAGAITHSPFQVFH